MNKITEFHQGLEAGLYFRKIALIQIENSTFQEYALLPLFYLKDNPGIVRIVGCKLIHNFQTLLA